MQTQPNPSTPSEFHRLLQWSAADLADPEITQDNGRFALEKQVATRRLSPFINDLVQLAWRQLQADQSSAKSAP